jgi:hypothetical protein
MMISTVQFTPPPSPLPEFREGEQDKYLILSTIGQIVLQGNARTRYISSLRNDFVVMRQGAKAKTGQGSALSLQKSLCPSFLHNEFCS